MAKHVLILTDSLGRGGYELGRAVMKLFIYSMARDEHKPASITLMNEGVRLACEGSDVLDDLKLLGENGVPVKACGICLDYLKLEDFLAVGEIGKGSDVVAALLSEDVVTIA